MLNTSIFSQKFPKQILSVNGTSLLNLPYEDSLRLLQNTGTTVELIVSQIFNRHSGVDNKWLSSTQQLPMLHETYSTNPLNALLANDNNNSGSTGSGSGGGSLSNLADHRFTQSNKINSNNGDRNDGGGIRHTTDDYRAHIHYNGSRNSDETTHQLEEKFIMRNGCENIARDFCNSMLKRIDDSHLVSAKSMPDLPKVSNFCVCLCVLRLLERTCVCVWV